MFAVYFMGSVRQSVNYHNSVVVITETKFNAFQSGDAYRILDAGQVKLWMV